MEVIIQTTSKEASVLAARLVARQIREKPNTALGLATGSTPLLLYRELARLHREEALDFSRVRAFGLDEYVGLAPDHPASFAYYLKQNLFGQVNLPDAQIHLLNGRSSNIPETCGRYEAAIRQAGGIDVQIVGIGPDGHLGFNEPSSSLHSRTRIKTLSWRTREHNASSFGDKSRVPAHVLTMGLGTILESQQCLLLAFGSQKAAAVAQAVEGPVTSMMPASVLQFHPQAKFFLDQEAAGELKRASYYREVYASKPEWQRS